MATLALFAGSFIPRIISVESLESLSITHQKNCQVMAIVASLSLMDPINSFILDGTLPNEQKDVEKIQRKPTKFWLLAKKKLYRKSFGGPYFLPMHQEAVNELLVELYGVCGSHTRV